MNYILGSHENFEHMQSSAPARHVLERTGQTGLDVHLSSMYSFDNGLFNSLDLSIHDLPHRKMCRKWTDVHFFNEYM